MTPTSVCIFSIMFYTYAFAKVLKGEFVSQSSSIVGDHFLYSCNLNVGFRGDIVRRNWMIVTLRG